MKLFDDPDLKLSASLSEDGSRISASFTPENSFPAFQGHFPGNPIMPGIAYVSLVTEIMTRTFGPSVRLDNAKRIKFLSPVKPGMKLQLDVSLAKTEESCLANVTVNSDGKKLSVLKLLYSGVKP